jgi:hypothetical protein
MSSRTTNFIKINGRREDLLIFIHAVQKADEATGELNVLDFENIIPYPPGFDPYEKIPDFLLDGHQYFEEAGRKWNDENWGTYSNSLWTKLVYNGSYVYYNFFTLYSPPIFIFHKIVKDWPNLTFQFRCEGEMYSFILDGTGSKGKMNYFHEYYVEIVNLDSKVLRILYRRSILDNIYSIEALDQTWIDSTEEELDNECASEFFLVDAYKDWVRKKEFSEAKYQSQLARSKRTYNTF